MFVKGYCLYLRRFPNGIIVSWPLCKVRYLRFYRALCSKILSNARKIRTPKIHLVGFQNSKPYQKKQKNLNFHDGLQSCQLSYASQSAHGGRSAGTGQQATLKAIVGIQFFSFSWPYTDIIDPWTVELESPYFSSIEKKVHAECHLKD